MKATHVRPLLAFWVLASVAAFITSVGLRAPSTAPVQADASTTPATITTAPSNPVPARQQLRPGTLLTGIVLPGMWSSAAAAEHAVGSVGEPVTPADATDGSTAVPATQVAAPGGSTSGESTGHSGGSGDDTAAARPTATATDPGPGKGHGKGHGPNEHSTSHPGKGRGH